MMAKSFGPREPERSYRCHSCGATMTVPTEGVAGESHHLSGPCFFREAVDGEAPRLAGLNLGRASGPRVMLHWFHHRPAIGFNR
jgi:hypothetical protein